MKFNAEEQIELRKHFVETIYSTLDDIVSPTPYIEIVEEEGNVQVNFLNGRGRLPKPNSTEITVLDLTIASLFFDDFNLLFEGETGIGKTYTSEALFSAIFGQEGHYTLRLSGEIIGISALEPFTKTILKDGIPRIVIDHEKLSKYGALFIDEINRGDPNEIFQVVDGKIHINEESGSLRIPIPGTDRYKKLAIIAAMNPSSASYNGTTELDLAGENRFLKFIFPNGVSEVASSQLEKILGEKDLHKIFWTEFKRKTGMEGGWRELYPIITDPEQFSERFDGLSKEFIDVVLGYIGYDPIETYERNAILMEEGGVKPKFSISKDNEYNRIVEIQSSLKHSFVRRDLKKIKDLSRLIAFIKSIKNKSYTPSVDLNDITASLSVILESKSINNEDYGSLMILATDARRAYEEIRRQLEIPEGYGLRQSIWQASIYAGQEKGFDEYIHNLEYAIKQLNIQTRNTVVEATIRSRVLADLVVLKHFSKNYKEDVEVALKNENPFFAFREVYDKKKNSSSVYAHRLDSILS